MTYIRLITEHIPLAWSPFFLNRASFLKSKILAKTYTRFAHRAVCKTSWYVSRFNLRHHIPAIDTLNQGWVGIIRVVWIENWWHRPLLGETNLISSLAGRWMKNIGSVGRNNNNNNPEIWKSYYILKLIIPCKILIFRFNIFFSKKKSNIVTPNKLESFSIH